MVDMFLKFIILESKETHIDVFPSEVRTLINSCAHYSEPYLKMRKVWSGVQLILNLRVSRARSGGPL